MTRSSHALTMANPIALGDSLSTSHNRGAIGNVIEVIAEQNAPRQLERSEGPSVQRCVERYRPICPDRATALRLLKSVPLPLTVGRVSRALDWPEHRAEKWIGVFSAKGELVKVAVGWAWRDR